MVIKLGLDDADFGRGVANSKKQVTYLAKEMSANMKIADMAGNQLGKLGSRYDGLSKIIGAQENQVKDLTKAYEESFDENGNATESTKRLASQLQDANGRLANYKMQLSDTEKQMQLWSTANEGTGKTIQELTSKANGAKEEIEYLTKDMSLNVRMSELMGDKTKAASSEYDGLTGVLKEQQTQVEALSQAYNLSSADGQYAESAKRIKLELKEAQIEMAETASRLAQLKVENEGFTGVINRASDSLITHGQRLESAGSAMTKGFTVPIVAGATAVTAAAISWESGFAGVLKTNDEVIDKNGKVVYSYKDLEDGLRGLSKELPTAHGEIAATAEAAGQLGIQTDNVVAFTKTMLDMGESTNMSAETAATALARFANITQMSQKDFDKLGSVIVDLGNNFATTEAEIVEMGLRLAGAGAQIGMTEGEIMGFAAALSSVGIEAQAGGSAFSKVMINMQLATETGTDAFAELEAEAGRVGLTLNDVYTAVFLGGKAQKDLATKLGITSKQLGKMYNEADKSAVALEQFAVVAGLTNYEFAEMFKNDPSKAIMKFVEGLGKAEEQGTSTIKILEDMDIKEVRLRDSLLRAANASDVFGDAIATGNKAWEENTALTEEASKRYATTESKLKMLKNEVIDTAIDLGGPFVDALRDGLEASKPLIELIGKMGEAFSDADPKTQKMVVALLATTAAAGPLIKLTGNLSGKVGNLGKSFVELSAEMAKKKAIDAVTQSFTDGNVSAGDLMTTLGGGVGTFGQFGGAAATASGPTGLGAMLGSLTTLSPVLLGVVGVGGALAVGYGAWKLFGEEAYNSAQRTKEWGVDVGKATGDTLGKLKEDLNSATGQFSLLEQGLNGNKNAMADNFVSLGQTIEESLIKKITGLDELISRLPETTNQALLDMIGSEKETAEKSLKIVQDNTQRINEIRERASNENRELNVSESKIIMDLANGTTKAYVDTLDVSAKEKQKILNAMNGDVEKASKKEAKLWLQSLGEQSKAQSDHAAKSRKEQEKYLEELGYNLKGEFAQKYLEAWDDVNQTTTDGFNQQMATIIEKYPELQNEVSIANGQLIDSTSDLGQAMIYQNEYILKNARDLSDKLAKNAKDNADAIAWTANDMTTAGRTWNSLELLDKEGKVKSNASEIVTEAAKNTQTWNDLLMVVHDADLDSNAKTIIGEAAIANGWWEGMAWEDKEAILQDEFSIATYKALDDNGKWQEMSFEEKKAILYSNTPETMAETLLNLGLWEEMQPTIKELDAKNERLLNALSKSEEKLNSWNNLPDSIKDLSGENYELLAKIYESEEAYTQWELMPNSEKDILANNADLMNKVLASTESMTAWNELDPLLKPLIADNKDLLAKIKEGTISQTLYDKNLPLLKKLLGDSTNIVKEAKLGEKGLDSYSANNPGLKPLLGDASNVIKAANDGEVNLDSFSANNPELKSLLGDSSNVIKAANDGEINLDSFSANNPFEKILTGNASNVIGEANKGEANLDSFSNNNPSEKQLRGNASYVMSEANKGETALTRYNNNNPGNKSLRAIDNASYNAGKAKRAVDDFDSKPSFITKTLSVVANFGKGVKSVLGLEKGTNFHMGGPAIVNDQRGANYKELIIPKGGVPFIPEGRNVFLPDLPRGSKVYTAAQTKQIIPHYAEGVGIPKNSTIVKKLEAVNDRNTVRTANISENDNKELVSLMSRMLDVIANLTPEINIYEADKKSIKELAREVERRLVRGV